MCDGSTHLMDDGEMIGSYTNQPTHLLPRLPSGACTGCLYASGASKDCIRNGSDIFSPACKGEGELDQTKSHTGSSVTAHTPRNMRGASGE